MLLHGVWNAAAITVSFSELSLMYMQADGYLPLKWIAKGGVVILVMALLALLIVTNRKLRQAAATQQTMDAPYPAEA